tara:strand:- start:283 stop:384 length:102 start_codon:yes stop_codon:yes gene_type:complete
MILNFKKLNLKTGPFHNNGKYFFAIRQVSKITL